MSIIKKIIILSTIFSISGVQIHLFAQKLKKLVNIKIGKQWQVYEHNGKICFAQSLPVLQAPKTNKRDAKLFVTFRPER